EPEEQRALCAGCLDRHAAVLDAELEAVPGLDAIAHLDEGEVGPTRREPAHKPFERRAPRAGDLGGLPAVHAHNGGRAELARDARVGTGSEIERAGAGHGPSVAALGSPPWIARSCVRCSRR